MQRPILRYAPGLPPPIPPGGAPHAYFDRLSARPDVFASYSLRDVAQVQTLSKNASGDIAYIYPDDPDPRRQDATRIRIRQGRISPEGNLNAPVGPTRGASLVFVFDFWMGAEWNVENSHISGHKNGAPFGIEVDGSGAGPWYTTQINYRMATKFTHNLPPGGPYVAMPFPQVNSGRAKSPAWWRDSQAGYPRAELPYTAPASERRKYTEAIQPFDTETYPPGQEFGLVAERWTRFWHYFERAPEEDWDGFDAYRWTLWFADTVRPPTRMMAGAVVAALPGGFTLARMIFGKGGVEDDAGTIERADLIAYCRNLVVLHGTSKEDVLTLLQPPVE